MIDHAKASILEQRLAELFPSHTIGKYDALYTFGGLDADGKVKLIRVGGPTSGGAPATELVDPYQLIYGTPDPTAAASSAAAASGGSSAMSSVSTAISGAGAFGQLKGAFKSNGTPVDMNTMSDAITQKPVTLFKELAQGGKSSLSIKDIESLRQTAATQEKQLTSKLIKDAAEHIDKSATYQAQLKVLPITHQENLERIDARLQEAITNKSINDARIDKFIAQRDAAQTKLDEMIQAKGNYPFTSETEMQRMDRLNQDITTAQTDLDNAIKQNHNYQTIIDKNPDEVARATEINKTEADLLKTKAEQEQTAYDQNREDTERQLDHARQSSGYLKDEGQIAIDEKIRIDSRNDFFKGAAKFGGGLVGEFMSWQKGIFGKGTGAKAGGIVGAVVSYGLLVSSLKGMNEALSRVGAWDIPTWLGGNHTEGVLGWLGRDNAHAAIGAGMFSAGLAVLAWWMNRRNNNADLEALKDINEETEYQISNPGGVTGLIAGGALAIMSLTMAPQIGMDEFRLVPVAQLTAALEQYNVGGTPITDANRYSTVFVEEGVAGEPTRMIWVNRSTDLNGEKMAKVRMLTFSGPVKITNPGPNTYIHALEKDASGERVANPEFAEAMNRSKNLAKGAKIVNPSAAQKALDAASAANKDGAELQ